MFMENWQLPIDDPEIYVLPADDGTRRRMEKAQKQEARHTVLLGLAVFVVTSLTQIGSLLTMAPTRSWPDVTVSRVSVRVVRQAEVPFRRFGQESQGRYPAVPTHLN